MARNPWPVTHGLWADVPAMRVPPVTPVRVAIRQSQTKAWALSPGPGTAIRSVGCGAMAAVVLLRSLSCSSAFITQVGPGL